MRNNPKGDNGSGGWWVCVERRACVTLTTIIQPKLDLRPLKDRDYKT